MGIPTSISDATRKRLCIQGFGSYSGEQLAAFRFGIRLPYLVCGIIAVIALAFVSIPLLAILLVIALFGVILPNHPLDYLYNYGIRQLSGRPKLPRRSAQIRFACGLASFWLVVTIILFSQGLIVPGIIWGALLVVSATLVGTTDICVPSMMYNLITNRRIYPKGS